MDAEWKFMTGDDKKWALPVFNDAEWPLISAGNYWESQGYNGYNGYAWYRKSVVIPDSYKRKAIDYVGFMLDLGFIDDAGEVYWNGTLVNAAGSFPPEFLRGNDVAIRVEIPAASVNWNASNLIAVRVYDQARDGGIFGNRLILKTKGIDELVSMEVKPAEKDHVITGSGPVKIPLTVTNNFPHALAGILAVTAKDEFGKNVLNTETTVKLGKGKSITHTITTENLYPGFFEFSCQFKAGEDSKSYVFRMACEPEKIVSPTDRPADFEDYWNRARRELKAVAPQFKMILMDSLCTPQRDVYLVEMRSLGNILVRGWYNRPAREGKYPAILRVQGYSSNQSHVYSNPENDLAIFSLNIRGHGNSCDHINPGFPGYLINNIEDPEMYIYRGAYMDCIRAVDFLFSRPEVDTSRVVVEGGSQGGALAFATAALDTERIFLCAPFIPFLSDFRDYFTIARWPGNEFSTYLATRSNVSWDEIYHTLSYIDIKNLSPWIKAPVFMGVGLMDITCPPHINFAAYNNLTVRREYKIYPWSGHRIDPDFQAVKYRWIRKNLGL
jgi:cephalosporin-C deacetylase-like acetyl esterase